MSVEPNDSDRVLFAVVPHTTSVRGSRFECASRSRFLQAGGAFNVQGLVTVTRPRFMNQLGTLNAQELREVEVTLASWLGLSA
jgi:mRNA interferase MazF